ncbi:hypothetical protein LTR49_026683, partial [Elasticomyces elasticus]
MRILKLVGQNLQLFDRHFRLLREDTVGQLSEAAKVELERLQDPGGSINDRQKHQTA